MWLYSPITLCRWTIATLFQDKTICCRRCISALFIPFPNIPTIAVQNDAISRFRLDSFLIEPTYSNCHCSRYALYFVSCTCCYRFIISAHPAYSGGVAFIVYSRNSTPARHSALASLEKKIVSTVFLPCSGSSIQAHIANHFAINTFSVNFHCSYTMECRGLFLITRTAELVPLNPQGDPLESGVSENASSDRGRDLRWDRSRTRPTSRGVSVSIWWCHTTRASLKSVH